ncbi:MAG TPA: DUF5916 domain-containing protein [Polyangiales bacterium]|nr:DUF5916 domain-containing protein [Polyangiales bacterium]
MRSRAERSFACALFAACSCALPVAAQSIRAVRVAEPPHIDGQLQETAWRDANAAEAFTQKAPLAGQKPSGRTVLRVLYDDEALYVAFDCEQPGHPVTALLARRDRPTESDWVAVAVDARGEGRSAFEFSVSAAGVLVDGVRFDDGKIAREWDGVWDAASLRRGDGWSAELRIPLRVLRATAERTSWGFQARRYVSAAQELDEWAYSPRAGGGEVSRYGRLELPQPVAAGGALELRPFAVARAEYQAPNPAIAHHGYRFEPSAGLDFQWQPGDGWALDGTLNPDFAQVEADRLILNLSRIELVFPEKRPFFLAGMEDFATPVPIFYSRRIGHAGKAPPLSAAAGERLYAPPEPAPIYGALKLTGDAGRSLRIAALSALTGASDVDIETPGGWLTPRLVEPLTSYNALRMRTQLAAGLDLGATATATLRNEPGFGWPEWLTSDAGNLVLGDGAGQRCASGLVTAAVDRCYHDAFVGSMDLTWRSPSGEYAIRSQGYASAMVRGPVRPLPDGTLIGPGDTGAGGLLKLSKQGGEHWILDGSFAAHSRKLDFNDLGFMDRQNFLRAGAYVEYRTLDRWAFLLETHSSLLAYGENNLAGLSLGRGLMFTEHVVLDGYWTVTLGAYGSAARFDDREVGDGTALERASLLGAVQSISTDPRQALVLSGEVAEERLDNGANVHAQLGLLWHPASMLELQGLASYTYNYGEPRFTGPGDSPDDLLFGRLYAQSAGLLVRAAYTFTPALTLQTYAQAFLASGEYFDYAHYVRVPGAAPPVIRLSQLLPAEPPALLPDFENASLAVNVVLRWEYALGSTLYFVYLRSQTPDIAVDPAYLPRLNLGALRNAPATDVFLIKLAYWIG